MKIPTRNLSHLQAKLNKLNKRASKLGCSPVYMKDTGVTERISSGEVNVFGDTIFITANVIVVYGEAPKLNGWSFIGTIDHHLDGNILRSVPGEEMPVEHRTAEKYCDHCKSKRSRMHTYVVKNEDGEYKQIGRQCLRDFLGHQSPEGIARHAEWLMDLSASIESDEASFNRVGRNEWSFDTEEFVTWVAYWTEQRGWLSSTKAKEVGGLTTAHHALNMVLPPVGAKEAEELRKHQYTPKNKETAQQALKWVREELAPTITDQSNEYQYNLAQACQADDMTTSTSGLVASVIVSWKKAKDLFEKRVAEAKQFADSEYAGKPGERLTITVKVLKVITIDSGMYGPTNIHRMQDEAGNIFIWFAKALPLDEEQTYTIKGTVKSHELYKDIKQTTLTRCRVLEDQK